MKLVILNRSDGWCPAYRGLERSGPPYIDSQGAESAVNQAFYWACNVLYEVGYSDDLPKAREVVGLYRQAAPSVSLDLIELTTEPSERPETGGELLGYDLGVVVGAGLSVIGSCLLGLGPDRWDDEPPDLPSAVTPLDALWTVHFRSRLNEHLLFSDYANANFCLTSLKALQRFVPNLCESNGIIDAMTVVGLWNVQVAELSSLRRSRDQSDVDSVSSTMATECPLLQGRGRGERFLWPATRSPSCPATASAQR